MSLFSQFNSLYRKSILAIAKIAVPVFAAGIVLGSAGTSMASSTCSPYGYYGLIDGNQYYNQACIATVSSGANATTWVGGNQSSTVPTGYMGGYARLYNASGSLKEYAGWVFNNSPVYAMAVTTPTDGVHQSYYSYGITAAYNGNGYNYIYTYQSPDLTY